MMSCKCGSHWIPPNAKLLYSRDVVNQVIKAMSEIILSDLKDGRINLVPIMDGASYFVTKLAKCIIEANRVVSIYPLTIKTYDERQSTKSIIEFKGVSEDEIGNLRSGHVIVCDDIVDTGFTLHKVYNLFKSEYQVEPKIAILFFKKVPDDKVHKEGSIGDIRSKINYIGLSLPNKYVFGCGLDLDGKFRDLEALYYID